MMLEWAEQHPILLVTAGFLLALIESLAVIGIVVPGVLLLFVLGALVGLDPWLLAGVGLSVAAGAIVGDGVSFWIGRRYGAGLRSVWPMVRYQHWLDAGEAYFARYGGKSIFIARFIGPLRPVVPLVAGSLQMPMRLFVPRMLAACVIWSPLMLLPGALFAESLEYAARFGGRLTLLLVVLVIGGWLLLWLTRHLYEFGARRTPWWLKNLALWLRRHPLMGRFFGPLFEPGRREVLSVVILGLMLLISLASLFAALLLAPFSTDAWESGFELSGLAASMRSHFADPLFFILAISGSAPVMFALIVAMTIFLSLSRRWMALGHWLMACLGGWVLALLLNALMGLALDRPLAGGSITEVPHTGLTLVVLVPGFAALMLAKDFRPRQRKWIYLVTTAVMALLAFSEFYLARATLNGLITALALAGGWLAIIGIGYRLRAGAVRRSGRFALLFVLTWVGIAAVMVGSEYSRFASDHRLLPPERSATMEWWWAEGWRELPRRRSRIGKSVEQRFDVQLAAPRQVLIDTLRTRGWEKPPDDLKNRLRARFAREIDLDRLGHIAADHIGRPEDVSMRLRLDPRRVLLLRGWDSGLRMHQGQIPVWLVQVREYRVAKWMDVINTWRQNHADADPALDMLRDALPDWTWAGGSGEPWRASTMRSPEWGLRNGVWHWAIRFAKLQPVRGQSWSGGPCGSDSSSRQSACSLSCGSVTASNSWACAGSSGSTEASAIPSALA